MNDFMANFFIDVHPSNAKLPLFHDGNCFIIASTVSEYSLWPMLSRLVVDRSTRSFRNAVYDCPSFWFEVALNGLWAKTIPNMR